MPTANSARTVGEYNRVVGVEQPVCAAGIRHDASVSSSWKCWLRLAAIPSTVFAAVVFILGWMSVSPLLSVVLAVAVIIVALIAADVVAVWVETRGDSCIGLCG